MIEINGSEGGGQILRTALSLSCILKKPVKFTNIRGARPKPGLQPQHLTCVNALRRISNAEVKGGQLGSQMLEFKPGKITAGNYFFDIGTAGSITLLAQCVLPVLLFAEKTSIINFVGGTHVPFSPPANYFSEVFLPTVKKMGVDAEFSVQRVGWFPVGGGKALLTVKPPKKLKPLDLTTREIAPNLAITAIYSQLPEAVGQRLANSAAEFLTNSKICCAEVNVEKKEASCPGCCIFVKADYKNCFAGFSSLGKKGKPAETVGKEAAASVLEFDSTEACIDEHLADQLLLYCALANGQSKFIASSISKHFETNLQTIQMFLEKNIKTKKVSNCFEVGLS